MKLFQLPMCYQIYYVKYKVMQILPGNCNSFVMLINDHRFQ